MPVRRAPRVAAGVVSVAVMALTGCAAGVPATESRTASDESPLSAGPPSEGELPPDYDEQLDGAPQTPDGDLPDEALTALLRTRPSAADGAEACGPTDVSARLSGLGARGEWGNRFALVVEPALPSAPPAAAATTHRSWVGAPGCWGSSPAPSRCRP